MNKFFSSVGILSFICWSAIWLLHCWNERLAVAMFVSIAGWICSELVRQGSVEFIDVEFTERTFLLYFCHIVLVSVRVTTITIGKLVTPSKKVSYGSSEVLRSHYQIPSANTH